MSTLFSLPPWFIIVVLTLLSFAVVVPLTVWTLRGSRDDRSSDNVMRAALALVGSAFVFIGAFASNTAWQQERNHDGLIFSESSAADRIIDDAEILAPDDVAALRALVADYLKAVIQNEYNRLTGLPGIKGASGAPSADAALDAVRGYIAERKNAGDWSKQTGEGMLAAYRALQQARQKRLAQRAAISMPVLVLVTVFGYTTLALIGLFPSGRSTPLRWAMSLSTVVIVVGVLTTIVLLVSPEAQFGARIGPAEHLLMDFR
jgi:hypothetical protein